MNAFARAAAALHRDPNLSVACTWAPGWDRAWPRTMLMDLGSGIVTLSTETVSLRGIEAAPIEGGFGVSQPGAIAGRRSIDVVIADLPSVAQRGDLVWVAGAPLRVETAEKDLEALTWRLLLVKAI